jgi:hypothetical protein
VSALRIGRTLLAAAVGIAVGTCSLQAAPPDVKYLFPAGAARGTTVEVTASGALKPWPCGVWVSGDGVRFEPAKAEGKFQVTVDPSAATGRRWVRFHTAEGASVLRAFVVGDAPELVEAEKNDELGQAIPFEGKPLVINGALGKAEDVDRFDFSLKKGQTFSAVLAANSVLGSPVDAVLQVVDDANNVRHQNHDDQGLDPGLSFTAPADGKFSLRLFGFVSEPNSTVKFTGAPELIYRLTVSPGPLSAPPPGEDETRFVIPADVPISAAKPGKITPPAVVPGRFAKAGEKHVYALEATKGVDYRIRVVSRSIGGSADPMLKILGSDGTLIKRGDDIGRSSLDVDVTWKAPSSRSYELIVEETFASAGPRHHYLLDVRPVADDYELTVAADLFMVEKGKPLEIPVTVVRPAGMTGEIDVSVEGLPEGAKVTAVSESKGESAKKVTLKWTAAKPFAGPIRIVGTLRGGPKTRRTAAATVAAGAKSDDLWLTVTGK